MKAFIVYWHPEPRSFNHAMFHAACEALKGAGNEVRTSDLHDMRFDPVSGRENFKTIKDPDYLKLQFEELHAAEANGFSAEIDSEIKKIEWCDLMIWQFPFWWFGLPAALKGWVDRVFAMGRLYGGGQIYETGTCRGKRALLSLTTGGPEKAYLKDGFNGDIGGILRPIQRGILQFVGFDVLAPQIVYGPARMTDDERARQLAGYASRLKHIGEESPMDVGGY
ncbi:MAG: NAD(P)H-dependent oxidoreductase [Candidatus Eisenbacteria bacterium]|uniref:NAD(P)H-dependent oxidoreductase n=1 Tax=Eiseniibacteriota bacterium TaxID=2212470 RepID=A0A948RUR8_UNCEI|nr:NAD(P)H-dependent oxidoreductase [Candidatus Eisenbacteria bacterium]MBU2689322.1 NAD(P)H-dependent oxidoreductase [Candidatus Eisenbacteria bacterium]